MHKLFLTNICLSRQNPVVKAELNNVYAFHQRLVSLLPPAGVAEALTVRGSREMLYRMGADGNLLIQSNCPLNCEKLPLGYAEKSQFKSVVIDDKIFVDDRQFRFRLTANPVYKSSRTMTLTPISDADRLIEWLSRKGVQHGFSLVGTPLFEALSPTCGVKRVGSTVQKISINPVKYEGILQIVDPQLFLSSIRQGIGRSKAFGCGLLSVQSLAYGPYPPPFSL
jgi:CRISPR system Cascade subunit CasE